MSDQRPTVSPELIAALIESTPERVRRRLDREPDAAANWDWQARAEAWSVQAGGETVTLPNGHVVAVEQITCTCLLSPRCFHVLACATRLQVAIVESEQATEQVEAPADDSADDAVEPDDRQRRAAGDLANSFAHLLRVGVTNAGVVVQSGLLRGVHQCRAEGLHRLAALGVRVIAGVGEFRARSAASDPAQLADDVADALETSRHIVGDKMVASFWIGTARRKQLPVRPRKLHGLFAEPLVTRSGFAGAAVYFLGEDGHIYSASDVRPGDAQHARDAYLGGIEIGPLIQPAKQLARGQYLGADMTASIDGRLGRGKSIKLVEQGQSSWQAEEVEARFCRALPDQWNAVYAQAALPADARPAGWDFVFLDGTVLGAAGAELLLQAGVLIRLAIANESPSLCFRENLRMLCHAPGLRLRLIARMSPQEPRLVFPLAIAPVDGDKDATSRLDIPQALAGRICLGFDEIQRNMLIGVRASAMIVGEQPMPAQDGALDCLRRRWVAALLAGVASQRPTNTNTLAAETSLLSRTGFTTGAALLDALSRGEHQAVPGDTFLAAAVYLRQCGLALAQSRSALAV